MSSPDQGELGLGADVGGVDLQCLVVGLVCEAHRRRRDSRGRSRRQGMGPDPGVRGRSWPVELSLLGVGTARLL